jgi:hypothetical protein
MIYTTVEEYNNYLVENQININIIEYVKEVNKIDFKIDIDFIDDFIELVSKKECCIHHSMLEKYGVLKLNKGTLRVKELLEQYEFKENKDFKLPDVREFKNGGRGNKIEYYLHPRAFKICLMRAKNTKIYAYYYLLLEECIKYFNDYQLLLKEKYIIKLKTKNKEQKFLIKDKDDKICTLEEKMNSIIEQNNKTHKMNEELLKSNKLMQDSLNTAHYKLDETLEKLDEVHEELENTNNELEDTTEKLDNTDKTLNIVARKLNIAVEDRVVKTRNKLKNESFVVMFNADIKYKYIVIRAKIDSLKIRIDKLKIENYTIIESLQLHNVPNASILWCLIKEELKDNIDYSGNKLNLININESQFEMKIKEIYNKRKNVII